MSDLLKVFDNRKFTQNVSLSTEHCLNYVRRACIPENKVLFTVSIPYQHLVCWYDVKHDGLLEACSYVEIMNYFIEPKGIKIREDCDRIDGLLRRICSEIKNKCRKFKGRRRHEFLRNLKRIAILQGELMNVAQTEE